MARRTGGFQSEIQQAEDKRTKQLSNNVLAIFLFVLACSIVAILVILNLPQQRGKTHVVYLYVSDVETHPYVVEDQKLIQQAVLKFDSNHFSWLPPIAVSSDDFLNDIARLESLVAANDHLIVYVAMPGAVRFENSQAIACLRTQVGEFALNSSSLMPVEKLLEKIYGIKAQSHFVVFDPGQPTVGMTSILTQYYSALEPPRPLDCFPQEMYFPFFLTETIKQSQAPPGTWALIANRTFEHSVMLESLGHSVIAHAFAKSLLMRDQSIDVIDLYRDISLECRRLTWWNPPAAGNQMAFGQIPVLLDVTQQKIVDLQIGPSQQLPEQLIAWVGTKQSEPPTTKSDADSSEPAANEASQSAPFNEIWSLVFQLENRDPNKPHSPIDFAPESWAQFVEQLMSKQVGFLATRRLDKNNDGELTRWRNELKWLLRNLAPHLPVPEDEPPVGTIQSPSLRAVENQWSTYLEQWNRGRPDETRQIGTSRDLAMKTLQAGQLRDALYLARFYYQGFDVSPDRFGQVTGVVGWMEQLALGRPFADRALLQENVLASTQPPTWNPTFPTWESTRSHWTFERDVRSFLLAGYLKREFPSVDPRHVPGPSEDDFRSGLAGAMDPQEGPRLNSRWFDQYSLRIINTARELSIWAAQPLALPKVEMPTQIAQLSECVLQRWPGVGDEPLEMAQRRRLSVVPQQALEPGAYRPPAIVWRDKKRGFQVAVSAAPDSTSSLVNGPQGFQVHPAAEYAPVTIDLTASLENIPVGSMRWQILDRPANALVEITQPNDAIGQDRRLLKIIPQTNREQTAESQYVTIEARPADESAPPQQFKFEIVFPALDRFALKLENSTWTEQTDQERELQSDFGLALKNESRLTIQPVTGIPTPLKVQVRNTTNFEQDAQAHLYYFDTAQNGLTPGRLEISWLSSANFEQLIASGELKKLQSSGLVKLPPTGWATINWGAEPNPGGSINGPLLVMVESPAIPSLRPARRWFSVIEIRRIRAGQTVRYAEERGSQPMYFERVPQLSQAAVAGIKSLNMKSSRNNLPFALGKTPGAEEREWNVTLEPPRTSTTGHVLLDLLGEPRALRYSFESTLNAKPLADRTIEYELTESDGLATNYFSYSTREGDLATTVWLINGVWNQEQRDKHQLKLKLDLVEKLLNQPWTLRRSTLDDQGNSSGANNEVRCQVDRREQFSWNTAADLLTLTTSAVDFQFPLPEGPSNLQYDVGLDDSTWARLRIIKRPPLGDLRRPRLEFGNTREDAILLKEKDRLEINVMPPAADANTILAGKLLVYWNDEAKPIWEQPITPESEGKSYTVPKALINEKLEKVGEYRVRATYMDFFGRESDAVQRVLRATVPPVKPGDDPKLPKPVDLTIQIKPSARIQSLTLSGVNVTRDSEPTSVMINERRVRVQPDLASGTVTFYGLAPGEYEVSAVRLEGFREEKSKVEKVNVKSTMTWTHEFKTDK